METLIFDRMELATAEEVARLLPLVSAQRREQAMRYSHTFGRFACLKSYEMLCGLLELEQPLFRFTEKGKPLLQDYPEIHFSISHCKNGIAVAVDDRPVGIDIESFRPFTPALLERCMNPDEAAAIRQAADPEQAFAAFWTKKEAVLKLRGTGLIHDLHGVLQGPETTITCFSVEKHYAYSVASLHRTPPPGQCQATLQAHSAQ
ncbi:MAG: 4'-phosphopantetheinyl transferase superfamily protein [Bacteroidales bacterium]|nr:4'-phosphopantetheinyl transferase superfamily protein [Bacteroidales bacterium]MBP5395773.1 4'-phosphopantetheinyl transferase superfamily protein [Bacteroidales bacterium]MBP5613163.1 4'-phosphopantetheinyl transferase superfamily protein [Bacteroidales bacterium]